MTAVAPPPPTRFQRFLLRRTHAALGRPPVRFALWDGRDVNPETPDPVGRIQLRDASVLRALLRSPQIAFGDAYCDGRIEAEGDIAESLASVFRAGRSAPRWARALTRLATWRPQRNTRRRARGNVHHHYDLGNDFYALWLDADMVYTCAYFPTPESTLEAAQRAKLDHVCRKLSLRPGEQVVEAGCGWGALALHMAEHYGVSVRAFNVSSEQVAWARERARERGLEKQVEFLEDDYRNIRGTCDVFVSVGMLEHVGRAHYRSLGRVIDRCLPPDGRGLLHFIGHPRVQPMSPWLERNIFPGAYIPALSEMLPVLEPQGLAVLDVENLRLHYALTLQHWLERYERVYERVARMYDERFARMWRLYLASSRGAFLSGTCQLWQVTFAREAARGLPWTRAELYAG